LTNKSGSEPSPRVVLKVGNTQLQTSVKENATNPKWEEKFEFLFLNADMQELSVEVQDCGSKPAKSLGTVRRPLKELLTSDDMTSSYIESLGDAKITLHLRLRMLTVEAPASQLDADSVNDISWRSQKEPDTVSVTESTGSLSLADPPTPASASDPSGLRSAGVTAARPEVVAGDPAVLRTSAVPVAVGEEPTPLPVDDVMTASMFSPLGSKLTADSNASASTELRHRTHNTPHSDGKFGSIQLTVRYSVQKAALVVVVHQCRNLIPCDASDNLADPYVRLFLLPDRSTSTKRKTKSVKNNLSPVFDESFEWPVSSRADVVKRTLEVSVKNHVGFSIKKERENMGQLQLKLSTFDDITTATTDWFQLSDPDMKP
jgi:hypothetical protein